MNESAETKPDLDGLGVADASVHKKRWLIAHALLCVYSVAIFIQFIYFPSAYGMDMPDGIKILAGAMMIHHAAFIACVPGKKIYRKKPHWIVDALFRLLLIAMVPLMAWTSVTWTYGTVATIGSSETEEIVAISYRAIGQRRAEVHARLADGRTVKVGVPMKVARDPRFSGHAVARVRRGLWGVVHVRIVGATDACVQPQYAHIPYFTPPDRRVRSQPGCP